MLQMSVVQLKILLNAKVLIAREYTSGVFVSVFSVMAAFTAAMVLGLPWQMLYLRKPQRKKSLSFIVRRLRWIFHFTFAADVTPPKLFTKPCHSSISSVKRSSILLESLFLLIKVLTILALTPSERFLLSFNNCKIPCMYEIDGKYVRH